MKIGDIYIHVYVEETLLIEKKQEIAIHVLTGKRSLKTEDRIAPWG